jgi:hypothetical protein
VEVISEGTPDTSMIEIGLPWAGRRNSPDEFGHRVAHQHAREHELIARIVADFLDLALHPHVGDRAVPLVELAHLVLQDVAQVRQQIGDRRILRDPAHLFGQPVLLPRHQQALGQDIGVDLALRPGRGEEHLAVFLEIHQPIGHLQVRHVEQLPGLAKGRIYSPCGSIITIWPSGAMSQMRCRISAAAVDLPVPVEPSSAKCLPSSGSI